MKKEIEHVDPQEDAKKEFEVILKDYILPLFECHGQLKIEKGSFTNKDLIEIVRENQEDIAFFIQAVVIGGTLALFEPNKKYLMWG